MIDAKASRAAADYMAHHNLFNTLHFDIALEVFGEYAEQFDDPEDALFDLTFSEQVKLCERVLRRASHEKESNREAAARDTSRHEERQIADTLKRNFEAALREGFNAGRT